MRSATLVLPILLVSLVPAAAQREAGNGQKPCREHPQVVAPCFTIRGRMSLYDGVPTVRIWRVGTGRMLGVSEQRFAVAGCSNLPDAILDRLSWDVDLFADFVVCPFTRDAPGAMQRVCVASARNVITRPRDGVPP